MKTLITLIGLCVWTLAALADGTPTAPATQAEVNAGTIHNKYVAPDTLKNGNIVLQTLRITQFGAKHSGHNYVGNIASGSASVTLTTGTVSAGDVGDLAKVTLGGGTNDVITTIASVSDSTHFVLTSLVTNTITGAQIFIATNDDTAAIQLAINTAVSNGIGTIWCDPGLYWITNLYIPTNSLNQDIVPFLTIVGLYKPGTIGSFASSVNFFTPSNDCVFVCCAPTGSTNPVVASRVGTSWQGLGLRVENLHFRMPANPSFSCLDFGGLNTAQSVGNIIDTGFGEYDGRMPTPGYTNAFAIIMPRTAQPNGGDCFILATKITGGISMGVKYAEHTHGIDLGIVNCLSALCPVNASGDCQMYAAIEGCNAAIDSGTEGNIGNPSVLEGSVRVETSLTGWWNTNGRTFIKDPQRFLTGNISEIGASTFTNWGGGANNNVWVNIDHLIPDNTSTGSVNDWNGTNNFNANAIFKVGASFANTNDSASIVPLWLGRAKAGFLPDIHAANDGTGTQIRMEGASSVNPYEFLDVNGNVDLLILNAQGSGIINSNIQSAKGKFIGNGNGITNYINGVITPTNFLLGTTFTNTTGDWIHVKGSARGAPTTTLGAQLMMAVATASTGAWTYTNSAAGGLEADAIFTTVPHPWETVDDDIPNGGRWQFFELSGSSTLTMTNSFYRTW